MAQLPRAEKFQDLIVWQKSHQLVLNVYRLTKMHFILCGDLDYLKQGTEQESIDEVGRLLGAYTRTLLSPAS